MSPFAALTLVIKPTIGWLDNYGVRSGPEAEAMLLAIGLVESKLKWRDQLDANGEAGALGPALGLWQFERGGGVKGVMTHKASAPVARAVVAEMGLDFLERKVWPALACNDALACAFARLLLWTDPRALPKVKPGSEEEAWEYYLRNWRPGKPRRKDWPDCWKQAVDAVRL